jgi:ketosteroid isomerase-like protein
MSVEDNKRTVLRYFELLSRNDVAGLAGIYDDAMALHVAGNTLTSGRYDKTRLIELAGMVGTAFPHGLTIAVRGMVAEGEKVAVEAESHGVHVSGKPYHNRYHFLITVRDGRILESREYMDTELVTDVVCGGQRPVGTGQA